mgnify:CR=1 FL=1
MRIWVHANRQTYMYKQANIEVSYQLNQAFKSDIDIYEVQGLIFTSSFLDGIEMWVNKLIKVSHHESLQPKLMLSILWITIVIP